ncbi:hypothetical protein BX285_1703 [Streptomyces sp. 1114.5]|uniref:hypothetical protein n=1 Tax=Streptomyces sp. 1114.5 TaxID=1938830 RepID=UPI000EAC6FA3|nr:hypothetical protein [Streptomyces sp. 1114.5]RKT17333.1 hypothetical protein BX285_1703 [Streptomyces sp. 1114.5]
MRATRMVVVLTAALALTMVATASATAAGHGAAASRTTVSVPGVPGVPGVPAAPVLPADLAALLGGAPSTLPAADPADPVDAAIPAVPDTPAVPAVPDPTAAIGDIIKQLTGLISSVTSGALDLGALQQLIAALLSALQGLIGQLPTLPVTVPPVTIPPVTVPTPPTSPGTTATLQQQLDTLRAQAHALTTAPHRHPATG